MVDIIIIIIGVIVAIDGFFSLLLQRNEHIAFQIGRIFRLILGLFLIFYDFEIFIITMLFDGFFDNIVDMIIIGIGFTLIIDGFLSLLLQRMDHLTSQIVRIFRIGIGFFLICYDLKVFII